MVDVHSATAEIWQGKERKIEETTGQKYMSASAMQGSHKELYDKNNEPLLREEFEEALAEVVRDIQCHIY